MQEDDGTGGHNIDVNLCKLLNIDVDNIALMIAMGKDPWSQREQEDQEEVENFKQICTSSKKSRKTCDTSSKKTGPSSPNPRTRSSCFNKTDKKQSRSTAASQTKESSQNRSNDRNTTADENMAIDGPSCQE